jgi:hypothetical protein
MANLPFPSLGPGFKGRDTALIQLRQRLTAGEGRAVGLKARQAIHGVGGVFGVRTRNGTLKYAKELGIAIQDWSAQR